MSENAEGAAGGDAPHEAMSDAATSKASTGPSKAENSPPGTDVHDAPAGSNGEPPQKHPDQGPSPARAHPGANGGGGDGAADFAARLARMGGHVVEVPETPRTKPLALELARKLWGEPTAQMGHEYCFGAKRINLRTGMWFDFESDSGGGALDLVRLASNAAGPLQSSAKVESETPRTTSIAAAPFKWIDPAQIPKRHWLYRPHYIRQFLSLVFASGGKGKSSQLIVEALAMVTGKPLLGITPEKLLRVWYWNGEDPEDELQRRFAATAKYYGLTPEDIGDRLFFNSGRKMPIVIAEEERHGILIYKPVIKELIATMHDNQIDVLIVDPFISCHRVSENNNSAIGRIAQSWGEVAEETNSSVMAAHHNRKAGGEGATVDDGRGASALRDAARTARTINTMTAGEAENAEIAERDRGYYFRADIGKANLTPPAEQADWFRLISVDLGNGTDELDVGDSIGVVTAWKYPAAHPPKVTRAAQDAIRADGPWRADQRATNEPWVGIPVAKALGVSLSGKAQRDLETWGNRS